MEDLREATLVYSLMFYQKSVNPHRHDFRNIVLCFIIKDRLYAWKTESLLNSCNLIADRIWLLALFEFLKWFTSVAFSSSYFSSFGFYFYFCFLTLYHYFYLVDTILPYFSPKTGLHASAKRLVLWFDFNNFGVFSWNVLLIHFLVRYGVLDVEYFDLILHLNGGDSFEILVTLLYIFCLEYFLEDLFCFKI